MIFKVAVLSAALWILLRFLPKVIRHFKNKDNEHKVPKVLFLERYMYKTVTGKFQNGTISSYLYQRILGSCKLFEKEGICQISNLSYIMIFSPESIEFFAREPAAAPKASEYGLLKHFLGEGLITSDGDKWKKDRKMLLPAFHIGVLQQEFPLYNKKAEELVEKIKKLCNESWIDLLTLCKVFAFNIVTEKLFDCEKPEKRARMVLELLEIAEKMNNILGLLWFQPWMKYDIFMNTLPLGKRSLLMREEYYKIIEKYMRKMKNRKLSENEEDVSEDGKKSFYNLLTTYVLAKTDFSDKDMADHIATYAAAGFETVALSLFWTTYLLGLHSDVQNKVYEEVKNMGKCITYEDTRNMKYTESVIKESIRLYSPVPITARRLTKDVDFKHYKIPKGTMVLTSICGLHRNSEVYPNPEQFIPERFLENREKPYTFLAFGVGERNCIGQQKAIFEVKVGIAHIVSNFSIQSLDPRDKVALNFGVATTPKDPVRIKLIPREGITN